MTKEKFLESMLMHPDYPNLCNLIIKMGSPEFSLTCEDIIIEGLRKPVTHLILQTSIEDVNKDNSDAQWEIYQDFRGMVLRMEVLADDILAKIYPNAQAGIAAYHYDNDAKGMKITLDIPSL